MELTNLCNHCAMKLLCWEKKRLFEVLKELQELPLELAKKLEISRPEAEVEKSY